MPHLLRNSSSCPKIQPHLTETVDASSVLASVGGSRLHRQVGVDTRVCFPGVSLLVPHGAVAEDTSWEMHMVIYQGGSR